MWQRLYLHIASRHQDVWPKMFKIFQDGYRGLRGLWPFQSWDWPADPQAQNFQGPFLSQNLCREPGILNTINVKIKDLCCPRNIQHYLIFLTCYSRLVVVQFKICRTVGKSLRLNNRSDFWMLVLTECLAAISVLEQQEYRNNLRAAGKENKRAS